MEVTLWPKTAAHPDPASQTGSPAMCAIGLRVISMEYDSVEYPAAPAVRPMNAAAMPAATVARVMIMRIVEVFMPVCGVF